VRPCDFGRMGKRCAHCRALYLSAETNKAGIYTTCCAKGTIALPPIPAPLGEIQTLFSGVTHESTNFLDNIRSYNVALNFASMKTTDERLFARGSSSTNRCPISALRISGAVQHFIGPLRTDAAHEPVCAQVYLLDPSAQLDHRTRMRQIERETMELLQNYILRHNRLYNRFVQMDRDLRSRQAQVPDAQIVCHAAERRPEVHSRRANAPAVDEIAFVLDGDRSAVSRDIVVRHAPGQGGSLRSISNLHRFRDPLQFTLLLNGEPDGHCLDLMRIDPA